MSYSIGSLKIDFSLRREVFFVVVGAFFGGIMMMLPDILYRLIYDKGSFYTVWIIFGHAIGIYSQYTILAGVIIHLVTASCIGIVMGLFLYKTGILEISKPINGLIYGLFTGIAVFLLWSIPIQQLVLSHVTAKAIVSVNSSSVPNQLSMNIQKDFFGPLSQTIFRNLIFGVTLGLTSSLLSIKLGKRFRCPKCSISFARVDSIKKHLDKIHREHLPQKKVVILGGGVGGVEALKKLQKSFENDPAIDISIVNKDNFLLFTPMLHEAMSGMIEPTHIAIPLRSFCKRARFVEAEVEKIDIEKRRVYLRNRISIGKIVTQSNEVYRYFSVDYDYLLVSLGGRTNYYNDKNVERLSFSMKTLYDANTLRSHIITTLEQADTLDDNNPDEYRRKKNLLTYVVVGGGFSGVETVGEINEFIKASLRQYYHNIEVNDTKVILVSSSNKVLPEMEDRLGVFAAEELEKSGVLIIRSSKVEKVHATNNEHTDHIDVKDQSSSTITSQIKNIGPLGSILTRTDTNEDYLTTILDNGTQIHTYTVVWTAGVMPESVLDNISCEKDKKGRLVTDEFLQVRGLTNVFAAGDCASIIDPQSGKPCPPTAQHAIRQGELTGDNMVSIIKGDLEGKIYPLLKFSYKTRGTMATVGKRKGVAVIYGFKILGIIAWMTWRAFYLRKIPVRANRIRVLIDWTIDLLFGRDIARLKTPIEVPGPKV